MQIFYILGSQHVNKKHFLSVTKCVKKRSSGYWDQVTYRPAPQWLAEANNSTWLICGHIIGFFTSERLSFSISWSWSFSKWCGLLRLIDHRRHRYQDKQPRRLIIFKQWLRLWVCHRNLFSVYHLNAALCSEKDDRQPWQTQSKVLHVWAS